MQDQEARRRRHDVDRQPDRAPGPAPARLLAEQVDDDRRLHRRAQVDPRRARTCRPTTCRVRLLHGRQHHPLPGPREDDGGRPAVHLAAPSASAWSGETLVVDRRRARPHRQPAPGRGARHASATRSSRWRRSTAPRRPTPSTTAACGRCGEVVLRSGHRVIGTPNHRLLVAGDGRARLAAPRRDRASASHVAVQYGAELWSPLPARFDGFVPSPAYGSQKPVQLPTEMTDELAFLLGAFAAEGHTTRSTWTVTITNSVDGGARAGGRRLAHPSSASRPGSSRQAGQVPGRRWSSSKTVVEFLEHLGCGARASAKRIPDAGAARRPGRWCWPSCRAWPSTPTSPWPRAPKWGDLPRRRRRCSTTSRPCSPTSASSTAGSEAQQANGKTYDEVYATGDARPAPGRPGAVPRARQGGAGRRAARRSSTAATARPTSCPGMSPRELYRCCQVPAEQRGPSSPSCATPRTRHVTRRSLERVAAVPGVVAARLAAHGARRRPPLQPRRVGGRRRRARGVRPVGAGHPRLRGQRHRQPQHDQHARGGHGRRGGAAPHRGVAHGPQGHRHLPRQLQGGPAAVGHTKTGDGGLGRRRQAERVGGDDRASQEPGAREAAPACATPRRSRSGWPTATAT